MGNLLEDWLKSPVTVDELERDGVASAYTDLLDESMSTSSSIELFASLSQSIAVWDKKGCDVFLEIPLESKGEFVDESSLLKDKVDVEGGYAPKILLITKDWRDYKDPKMLYQKIILNFKDTGLICQYNVKLDPADKEDETPYVRWVNLFPVLASIQIN